MKKEPKHLTLNVASHPTTMKVVSTQRIILIALGIIVFKVLLLYMALTYVDKVSTVDFSPESSSASIGFSEFRDGELVITEISSDVSLDDEEMARRRVTDNRIGFDTSPRRSYGREKRMLQESTVNFFPPIIKTSKIERLLPNEENPVNDRVFEQMNHVPLQYHDRNNFKTIYLYGGRRGWGHTEGQSTFLSEQCLVNRCRFTFDKSAASSADAVVFGNPKQLPVRPPFQKSSQKQVWIVSAIEAPPNTSRLRNYRGLVNWTMTYRTDSIIMTPYFKYKTFPQVTTSRPHKNYALGRTKQVLWFVSNCNRVNSGRMAYGHELKKHISVDIYGRCGELKCARTNPGCKTMLKTDYKFYLAFENNKCKDYMTEKIMTAYENDVIPIVLGAANWEYKNALPSHSYIDVEDFETPRDLANYLQKLDENDDLYNEYFQWKSYGDFVASKPWCRVCSLLHEVALPSIWYDDVDAWWRSDGTCVDKATKWKNVKDK